MRALITGGVGFVGTHLSRHLVECRDSVAVTYLPIQKGTKDLEERLAILPKSIQSVALDVGDKAALGQILSLMQPEVIYHLAAISFVPDGEGAQDKVLNINAFGTRNIIEAIKEHSPKTRLLLVSSSQVYGAPRVGSQAILETAELRPNNHYGVSKALAEHFLVRAVLADELDGVIARPFPHIGPLQEDRFSLSSFAKQITEIKLGKKAPVLEVGDLSVKRDFCDVSDVVRGYRDMVLNGKSGEAYNLCSGVSFELAEFVNMMLKLAGVEAEIKQDPARMRPADIQEHLGSYQKANREFGWKPRVEVEAMLNSMLSYWEEALQK
jgi:GDP-4-dehydro-6-deoxy-D-mannose reductase